MRYLYFCIAIFLQAGTPFKPAEEFQVNVDMKFKPKPLGFNPNSYEPGGMRIDKVKGDLSAYLELDIVNVKVQPDEERITVVDSRGLKLLKAKTSPLPALHFEMGFVDDLKMKTVANEITVNFLSGKKKELRKIVMTVTPDGEFLVNGKWHGKF